MTRQRRVRPVSQSVQSACPVVRRWSCEDAPIWTPTPTGTSVAYVEAQHLLPIERNRICMQSLGWRPRSANCPPYTENVPIFLCSSVHGNVTKHVVLYSSAIYLGLHEPSQLAGGPARGYGRAQWEIYSPSENIWNHLGAHCSDCTLRFDM